MNTLEKPRLPHFRGRTLALAAFVVLGGAGVAACGADPYAPLWADPDTAFLYSLARPELNLASGFDLNQGTAVRIESADATGSWDFAVDTRNGKLVLLAPGALGVDSRARIVRIPGVAFDDVVEAPADTTLYTATTPVPVDLGNVYVVRTRLGYGIYGQRCVFYAKLEPLEVDPVGGTLRFVFNVSPSCNDRRLIPPD